MRQTIKTTSKDIGPVIPNLALDMELAIEKGLIVDKGLDITHNDMETPSDVGPIVTDSIEAMEMSALYQQSAINAKKFSQNMVRKAATPDVPAGPKPSQPDKSEN